MKKKRILIIDNERNFTNVLRLRFENTGNFVVLEENNALNGLNVAKSFRPDLILIDIHMHGLSGGELAWEMRNDPDLEGIPLIFLTGLVKESEERRISGTFYVSKPVRINYLLDCIATILNQPKRSDRRKTFEQMERRTVNRSYAYN